MKSECQFGGHLALSFLLVWSGPLMMSPLILFPRDRTPQCCPDTSPPPPPQDGPPSDARTLTSITDRRGGVYTGNCPGLVSSVVLAHCWAVCRWNFRRVHHRSIREEKGCLVLYGDAQWQYVVHRHCSHMVRLLKTLRGWRSTCIAFVCKTTTKGSTWVKNKLAVV